MKLTNSSVTNNCYTDRQIATILGITKRRLLVKICEKKGNLPPYFKIPGTRMRLWPIDEFERWLATYLVKSNLERKSE